MSQRVVGYEGEGRHRRPVYADEGPASAAATSAMAMLERGGTPKGELTGPTGGAGAIERRQLYEAQDDIRAEEARQARIHAPPNVKAATPQVSRQRGADANRARVAALQLVTSPPEDPAMPDAAPNPFVALSEAAQAADDARLAKEQADITWEEAREALAAAWGDVGPLVLPKDPDAALGQLVEVAAAAIDAGVAAEEAAPELQVVRDPDPAPTPPRKRNAVPAEITARQKVVLSGLKAGQGRAEIARELNVTYQTVDGLIEAMAKKGQIPSELFPLLPARFARYATVQA